MTHICGFGRKVFARLLLITYAAVLTIKRKNNNLKLKRVGKSIFKCSLNGITNGVKLFLHRKRFLSMPSMYCMLAASLDW